MEATKTMQAADAVYEATPRLAFREMEPAPFPRKGDELAPEADTAPDYPLAAYLEAMRQDMAGADIIFDVKPRGTQPEADEAAPEELPAEVEHQRDLTRIAVLAALTPEEIKAMTEEERALVREHIVNALQTATDAEARVKVYARVMDVYMLDTLIGFFAPEIGDLLTAAVGATYLLWEANNADLTTAEKLKIVGWQVLDLAAGAIPGVDLVLDTLLPANMLAARYFTEQVTRLAENARAAGVPEEVVRQMYEDAKVFQERVDVVFKVWNVITGGNDKDKDQDPPRQIPAEA